MRTILKIIAAPFVLALILTVAVLSFLCLHRGRVLRPCVYGFCPAGGLRLFRGAAYRAVLLLWCWRSLFPPLGSRPSGSGCWIVCMG